MRRLALNERERRFQAEVRSYIASLDAVPELDLHAVRAEMDHDAFTIGPCGRQLLRRLGSDGWLGVSWPVEYGGQGRTTLEHWIFLDEMARAGLPGGSLTSTSIVPALIRVGSDEQKRDYIDGLRRGALEFALGYTEPDAGTDLAALRTVARRTDRGYLISGEKIFTSGAHVATHLWVAARTGAPESRHRGISLFIIPVDAPGVTIRALTTQTDERTNQVFLDAVPVAEAQRVGAENDGWRPIMVQLDLERLLTSAILQRQLDELARWHRAHARRDSTDVILERSVLATLAADVEAVRLLVLRSALMVDAGHVPEAEASMAKILHSETRQRIALEGLRLMGPRGQLRFGDPGAPLGGRVERALRGSTVYKFGAGTNELQRTLVAVRGLGVGS